MLMPSTTETAPIAVFSFNRPHYLRQVLRSLAGQEGGIADGRVHLFQDGWFSKFGNCDVADASTVRDCIDVFKQHFPAGHVHLARRNLGVAHNIGRAQRFLLGAMRAPVAYFFEDDMVLSPYYLGALASLARIALDDERIGYVAAYGDHFAGASPEAAAAQGLIAMEHNWGFALTRRHWLEQQPILRAYRRLLWGADYRDRPQRRIKAFFHSFGYEPGGTSQDCATHLATLVLGRVRLRCVPCYGHYIGEHGLHFTPAAYEAMGFRTARLCPTPPPRFKAPTETELSAMLEEQRLAAGRRLASPVPSPPPLPPAPELALPLDGPSLVRLLYRGLLGREPDTEGGRHHAEALLAGRTTPEALFHDFVSCREFKARHGRGDMPVLAEAKACPTASSAGTQRLAPTTQ